MKYDDVKEHITGWGGAYDYEGLKNVDCNFIAVFIPQSDEQTCDVCKEFDGRILFREEIIQGKKLELGKCLNAKCRCRYVILDLLDCPDWQKVGSYKNLNNSNVNDRNICFYCGGAMAGPNIIKYEESYSDWGTQIFLEFKCNQCGCRFGKQVGYNMSNHRYG